MSSEKIARIFVERTGLISNVKIKNPPNVKNSLRSKVEGLIKEADVLVAPPDHFVDRMVWEEVITKIFLIIYKEPFLQSYFGQEQSRRGKRIWRN